MENDIQDKSRTRIKKEAEELQKLGEDLIQLSNQQLECMELPDDLRNALIEARSIKSNIAARRHRQFIGALMRDVDPEPIRQALMQTNANIPIESKTDKETRMWLEKLLTGDPAEMEAFLHACPGIERQRLRQLLRHIKKETTTGKSSQSLKLLEQLIHERQSSSV
jgi:ribosome-associated protein